MPGQPPQRLSRALAHPRRVHVVHPLLTLNVRPPNVAPCKPDKRRVRPLCDALQTGPRRP